MRQLSDEQFDNIVYKYSKALLVVSYNYLRDYDLAEDASVKKIQE